MSCKDILIKKFGLSKSKNLESFDNKKLFVKCGITVIAGLAGSGKTTKVLIIKSQLEQQGYCVSYLNFDSAVTYEHEMIEPPVSKDELEAMFQIIEQEATGKDIIVIDSLKSASYFDGSQIENNEDMYLMMLRFRSICKKTNCSIILVHHSFRPKNLKSNIDSFYGARAIEEQCDSGFLYYQDFAVVVKSRLGYKRDEKIYL